MNNKKLVAILALTGAIANLGLATAFAATSAGTETIGCNTAVSPTLSAPTVTVNFENRTTNFHTEHDAKAESGSVVVYDNRGFDAGTLTTETCGVGFKLDVVSNGLKQFAVDGSDYAIQLGLGDGVSQGLDTYATASTAWTEDGFSPSTPSSPVSLLGSVVNADATSSACGW